MSGEELKPRARVGLLTADHSKKGRRFVTILDPEARQVTLLEPWEHAILVLCDGTRDATAIAKLLESGVDGEPIDLKTVRRSLKLFEREKLIEGGASRAPEAKALLPSMSARTLANLQDAYREWHKDPVRTGQILSGVWPSFDQFKDAMRASLDPTVALPEDGIGAPAGVGSTLFLAEAESLLSTHKVEFAKSIADVPSNLPTQPPIDRKNMDSPTVIGPLAEDERSSPWNDGGTSRIQHGLKSNAAQPGGLSGSEAEFDADVDLDKDVASLLAEVDQDFREVESREAEARSKEKPAKTAHVPPPIGKAIGGEAIPPESKDIKRPAAKVVMEVAPDSDLVRKMSTVHVPERQLAPTTVGPPPPEAPHVPPILLSQPSPDELLTDSKVPLYQGTLKWRADELEEPEGEKTFPEKLLPRLEGLTLEDVSQVEGPTESAFTPASALAKEPSVKRKKPTTRRSAEKGDAAPTATIRAKTSEHVIEDSDPSFDVNGSRPVRAKEVFDRLRRAGLKARSYVDTAFEKTAFGEHPTRRRDEEGARKFDEALRSLSAGDLEVALKHFKRLFAKMPKSRRLAAFIEAIEAVRTDNHGSKKPGAPKRQSGPQRILESFEGILEEAVAYGRCPACFSMVQANFTECFACGFALSPPPKKKR
jgi:hypothetical protein